ASSRQRRPNKSFKPKPLRYANHMADTACHVLRSTTRLGLTLALGGMSEIAAAMIEKLENQLSQLILYIGAIDALSEEYRSAGNPQNDPFLFGTVYDGLWD